MTDWIESRLLPLVMAFAIGCIAGMDATERQMREAHPVTVAMDCDDASAQPAEQDGPMYVRAQ
jgi:hypothetical protein